MGLVLDKSVKPWNHPAALPDEALLAQCETVLSRSSGPGGQHRNKVQSHVELIHTPTGTRAQAGERRSAVDNKRVALRRVRLALAVGVRVPVPIGEIGSALWRSRLRAPARASGTANPLAGNRIVCSPDHHDYPALLAEALDVIAAAEWDMKRAALRLDVSASQLVGVIRDYPPALRHLNEQRVKQGQHELR